MIVQKSCIKYEKASKADFRLKL